jgi:hypothetical protein
MRSRSTIASQEMLPTCALGRRTAPTPRRSGHHREGFGIVAPLAGDVDAG